MKLFSLDFTTLILRFYLLMAIVIGSFFTGYPILAFLTLPIFLSAMMGVKFIIPRYSWRTNTRKDKSASVHHQTAH
ncbi:MAG: hypothetical protein ABIQ11_06620 [Saprospiraceae bacterium]